MLNKNSKIFVAGHNGLVGSAIVRKLKEKGYKQILTINKSKLDLTNQSKVFKYIKPKFIFIAAAKVGEFSQIIIQGRYLQQQLFKII